MNTARSAILPSIIHGALTIGAWLTMPTLPAAAADAANTTDDDKAAHSSDSFSGNVSWYGTNLNGKKTASGEIFDMSKCTAAHLHLPFGTKVLVEDPRTGKTVMVRVNDRGPFVKTRVMDIAKEGAKRLGTLSQGVVFVDCLIITKAANKNS